MSEIIGYAAAALVGLSLGLVGSGGSFVTVPLLVYLFHVPPLVAIPYSLFIVGATSLVGAASNIYKKQVDFRTAAFFGASSLVTIFLIRTWLIPIIPMHIASIGGFDITFSFLTMIVFAILMLFSAFSMIRKKKVWNASAAKSKWWLLLYGAVIGIITGFLGAGGGFLLIPVLVIFLRLDMKKAVGTSLIIIAINTLIGFIGGLGRTEIDWQLLLSVTGIAVAGILVGGWLSKYFHPAQLKKRFGLFVLIVAVYHQGNHYRRRY